MALQVDPPLTNKILDIQQAWHKLIKMLNSQFVETGWDGILFVDATDGNDATAKRGSLTFKYQTIQAALDDAQDSDIVWVGPGTYAEALTWPVDANGVTLQGVGRSSIVTAGGTDRTITIAPTADTVRSLFIRDINLINTDGLDCIYIAGANDLNLGNAGIVLIEDVACVTSGNAVNVNICGEINITSLIAGSANLRFQQHGQVIVHNARVADVHTDNDPASTSPASGFGALILDSMTADGDVTVNNLSQLAATDDTQIGSLAGDLVDTAGGDFGSVICSGRVVGNITMTFDFDDDTHLALILDQARIGGTFSWGLTGGVVGGNIGRCRANGAIFYNGAADTITAGDESALDLRGALFEQVALECAGSGTIDRSEWWQSIAIGDMTPNDDILWGNAGGNVPFTSTPNFVSVEAAVLTDAPVAVTATSDTGCSVEGSANPNTGLVLVKATLTEV